MIDPSHGPVITSTVRSPDRGDDDGHGAPGFYLQDAGYPAALSWLVQVAAFPSVVRHVAGFALRRMRADLLHSGPRLDPGLEDLFADTALAEGSMPLLGMGLDVPNGVFGLDHDNKLTLDWSSNRSAPVYAELQRASKDIAQRLDARFLEDPLTTWFRRFITVHPLGGCPMGTTSEEGVVDEWGRVHGHPHLHVADGSVMPGPVGANPSLTIAALADRFAETMIDDMNHEGA